MSARKKPSYAKVVLGAANKILEHEDHEALGLPNDLAERLRSWATAEVDREKKAARAARLRAKADELEAGE